MRQLSGVDSLHVLEETGDQHMHTIKMAIVAPHPARGALTVDEVRQWARDRLVRVPPLRWTVHKIPLGLGRPVFVDAGPIDVERHIRVERLTGRDDAELDEVVSRVASEQLPRDRPLWDLTVVEGLSGERVALVFKLHHAIMDGQASVRFLEVAFDGGDLDAYGAVPASPEPSPTKPQLVGFAVKSQATLWANLPKVTARTVRSISDNRARKKGGAPPVVNPLSGPTTRFNKWPKADRVYVDVTVPFAEIKAVKDATGRTVNEVFVTLCGGAIRRYLEEHAETPDRCLNCAHPISLRSDVERDSWGNRTSYWYVSLGTDIADPLARLDAVKQSLDAAREWAKGDVELFAVWQDYYLLFGKMTLKSLSMAERMTGRPAFNAIVSNVKGPPPLTLNGAEVTAVRSMGPITRVLGLNLTAWSYRDDFSVGMQSCTEFVPDLRRVGEHFCAELAVMKAAAGAASSPASA